MTEKAWLRVGARLLGVYFLVLGAMGLSSIWLAAGTVTEPYTRKWLYVATPTLQVVIAVSAGLALCVWSRGAKGSESGVESGGVDDSVVAPALQLIGVVALITGSRELAGLARRLSYSEPWPTEVGQVLSAVVGLVLGVALILRSSEIASWLRRLRKGA